MRPLFLVLSLLLAGFPLRAQEMPAQAQPALPAIDLAAGKAHVAAEIARTPQQMEAGLMYRTRMGDNDGMLFVLGPPQQARFWMANTYLPLSVAYLDRAGKIVEIHDMKPLDRSETVSASQEICYALEMNQGWFSLNGVPAGVTLKPSDPKLAFGKPPLSPP